MTLSLTFYNYILLQLFACLGQVYKKAKKNNRYGKGFLQNCIDQTVFQSWGINLAHTSQVQVVELHTITWFLSATLSLKSMESMVASNSVTFRLRLLSAGLTGSF